MVWGKTYLSFCILDILVKFITWTNWLSVSFRFLSKQDISTIIFQIPELYIHWAQSTNHSLFLFLVFWWSSDQHFCVEHLSNRIWMYFSNIFWDTLVLQMRNPKASIKSKCTQKKKTLVEEQHSSSHIPRHENAKFTVGIHEPPQNKPKSFICDLLTVCLPHLSEQTSYCGPSMIRF